MKILLSFSLLFLSLAVEAQTLVGLRAGVNYNNINGIGSTKASFHGEEGAHGGLFLLTTIGSNLYFQPELLYNIRGFNFTRHYSNKVVSRDTLQFNQNTRLHYLDLPIVSRLQLNRIYFEAGPQFGFLLSGRSKNVYTLDKGGSIEYKHTVQNLIGTVEPVDIGFIVGVGYQLNSGLGVGLRYNQGFREVMRRVNWQKNVSFQASLSYILGYKANVLNNKEKDIPALEDDYFDPAKAKPKKEAGYKIGLKQNVMRVSVVKVGESVRSEIQYVFNSVGSRTPSNILISGSSGFEEMTPLFTGFRDIEIPFKGVVRYTVQSTIGEGSVESSLELELTEPGIWKVNILTQ